MKHTVNTVWSEGMKFQSEIDQYSVQLDAQPENGGTDAGPSPKKLLLSALAGCTGMDVVAILQKMRVSLKGLNIIIEAEMTEEHPKHYSSFHITYEFSGNDLEMEKLEKAVTLSQEKYCGVSFMFRQFAKISSEIKIVHNEKQ
jgi:putative redox protein